MRAKFDYVGFDDIFQAITIIVQPYDESMTVSINTNTDSGLNLNIILGILFGILVTLTCICTIYCIRYYHANKRKKRNKKREENNMKEGEIYARGDSVPSKPFHEIVTNEAEQVNLKSNNGDDIIAVSPEHPRNTNNIDYAEPDYYDEDPNNNTESNSNKLNQGILLRNNNSNNHLDVDLDGYQEDDKVIDPGYYMNKLQKGYLSTDAESGSDENEDDGRNDNIDRRSSDSLDNRSVISSIISFGKRNKNKKRSSKNSRQKQEKIEVNLNEDGNHKRKKRKKHQKKRSFHWGFTDDGSGQGEKHNNSSHIKSYSSPNAKLPEFQHIKSLSGLTALEMQRNSSYHSQNNNHYLNNVSHPHLQMSHSICSNNSNNSKQTLNIINDQVENAINDIPSSKSNSNKYNKMYLSVNGVDDEDEEQRTQRLADAEFLAQLSPSVKSVEDMYSPISPNGCGITKGGPDYNDAVLLKPLSPNKTMDEQDVEMNALPHIIDNDNDNDNDNETMIELRSVESNNNKLDI